MQTQLRRSEHLRKVQAQHGSEGEESKKGREYPAPPASAEAGRLGIAKNFGDLLLECAVAHCRNFRSSKFRLARKDEQARVCYQAVAQMTEVTMLIGLNPVLIFLLRGSTIRPLGNGDTELG
jgi:hypothetical protein